MMSGMPAAARRAFRAAVPRDEAEVIDVDECVARVDRIAKAPIVQGASEPVVRMPAAGAAPVGRWKRHRAGAEVDSVGRIEAPASHPPRAPCEGARRRDVICAGARCHRAGRIRGRRRRRRSRHELAYELSVLGAQHRERSAATRLRLVRGPGGLFIGGGRGAAGEGEGGQHGYRQEGEESAGHGRLSFATFETDAPL